MNFKELCETLEQRIQDAYSDGVTLDEAEKLAGQFLHAQMKVSNELKRSSLDARMRKSGVKAVRAAVYLGEISKADKKPSDVLLTAIVDSDPLVGKEEQAYIEAEELANELERYYNVFREAHTYFRQVSRGVQG